MGRHIWHTHSRAQVHRKRERDIEREICAYIRDRGRVYMARNIRRVQAEGWAISISIERPRRTAGSCWLRGEYNEEISSEKGMRLRWIRTRGFPPTFISPSPSPPPPPPPPIISHRLECARARVFRVSRVSPRSHLRRHKQERPLYTDYCRSWTAQWSRLCHRAMTGSPCPVTSGFHNKVG